MHIKTHEILKVLGILNVLQEILCQINYNGIDNINNRNFKSVPTTVKTFENDTVLLPCYYNTPFRYVRWHRDDSLLIDSRHPENPPPERVHLWINGSLQVSNVLAEDSGDYTCELLTVDGHAVQFHAIEVLYPPSVTISPSGVIEIPLGSLFEIICDAKGIPFPAISWKRNGEIISTNAENKRELMLEVTSRQMSGPIECFATNGVKQPASAEVHLNVLFKPEVNATVTVVHTKISMRAHLECLVEAAPPALVHWFHHGVPIPADTRIARHDVELQGNRSLEHYYTESKHTLIIKRVKDHDLGMYECRAENRVGFQGAVIELTGRPMACVFKPSPTVAIPLAHNLIWQTESLSPIIEYKLRFRQVPSGNITPQNRHVNLAWTELTIPADSSEGPIHAIGYTLRGLQPASVYEVTVTSRNRYGWSDASKVVRFATGGEIEVTHYSTQSEFEAEDEFNENLLTDLNLPGQYDYSLSSENKRSKASNILTQSVELNLYILLMFFVFVLSQ